MNLNVLIKIKLIYFLQKQKVKEIFSGKLNKKLNILLFGKNQEDEFYNFIKQISYTLDNRKDNNKEE